MPATTDGRCWACVQRRRWYPEDVGQADADGVRHLTVPAGWLCQQPRRGRSARPEAMRVYRARSQAKARAADPEGWLARRREAARRADRQRRYSLTPEQYAARLAAQGGGCAICGTTEPGGRGRDTFYVDHNHTTGQVRGLLCCPCNLMLGHASDNPDRLRQGAAYLIGANMIHARPDYTARIQDSAGLIPDDEPVLLIRGQDQAALAAGRAWYDAHVAAGGDGRLAEDVRRHLVRVQEWQAEHGSKVADR